MSRGNRTDSLFIYAISFVGIAFLIGWAAMLLLGPDSPITAGSEIPATWYIAGMLAFIGPVLGTLIGIYLWGAGNGR